MEKTASGTAVLLAMHIGTAQATPWDISATITFYDTVGSQFFSDSGVAGSIDFAAGTGQLSSGSDFQGFAWVADVDAVFLYDSSAGGVQNFSYTWTNKFIDTGSTVFNCRTGTALDGCSGVSGTLLASVVNGYDFQLDGSGQFALGYFWDWGGNLDVPIVSVQQGISPAGMDAFHTLSLDSNGDGIPGHPMSTAPLVGETWSITLNATNGTDGTLPIPMPTAVPVPAAAWLFGSGLPGLIGVARRKRTA